MKVRGRMLAAALLAVLLGAMAARPAAAQSRPDSAAVLLDAARQLRAEGRTAAAAALLELIERRFGDTAAGVEAARLRAEAARAPEPERSGRTELLVFGTTYGAWLGAALPLMADADSPEAYGAGLLLGAPAGFLASKLYLDRHPLTEGQARALTFGGTWGTWQGFGWVQVLGGEEYCDEFGGCYRDDPSAAALAGGAVAGGLAGIATGAVLARKPISSGVATTVSFGGLWGTWFGTAAGVLMNLEDEDLLAAALAGGDAGLLTTALLAPRWNPSRSRARLVSLGGVVGLLGGLGIDLLVQPDDDDVAILIPAATSAAGLLLAARATRRFDAGSRDPGGAEPGGALLDYRGGAFALDVPAAALRWADGPRGARRAPALYLPVLAARF